MPTDLDDAEDFMLLSALEKLRFGKAVSNNEIESAIAGRHVGKHRGPCLCLTKFVKSLATSLEWIQLQYRRSCVDL